MISLFEKHFHNTKSPQTQIMNFCTEINESYQKYQFMGGCLLGNMALELSDIDEIFRKKIDEKLKNWKQELVKVLEKMNTEKSAEEIADYIIWGLEGLTLTGKVHKTKSKNQSEFDMFKNILNLLMENK